MMDKKRFEEEYQKVVDFSLNILDDGNLEQLYSLKKLFSDFETLTDKIIFDKIKHITDNREIYK